MTYRRVLPRDLFNEANLLKCLGKIALLVTDGKIPGLHMDDSKCDDGFQIEQDPSDGSIYIANLAFADSRGEPATFRTTLNSKDPWPLVMTYRCEEYYPINSKGEYQLAPFLFTQE